MEKLSLFDFQKLCRKLSPLVYTFDSENSDMVYSSQLKLSGSFSDAIFLFNPNCVCFRNETDQISFDGVQFVYHQFDIPEVGHIFRIVCGGGKPTKQTYTVIAYQKKT